MRTVVFNHDVELDNSIILQLFGYLFSLLVGLLIIVQAIMCYYSNKLSNVICFIMITDTIFTLSIQNGVCNDLYSIPSHTRTVKIGSVTSSIRRF